MFKVKTDRDIILNNKELFDEKLIRLIESKDNKIKKLNNSLYNRNMLYEKAKEENLKLKTDLKKSADNLKSLSKKCKDQEDEIEKFRRELEELKKRSDEKDRLIEKLKDEIDNSNRLKDEIIKDLNIKIKKLSSNNSTNSNMPSSFDINSHSKPVHVSNSRKKSTRSKGGQKGHIAHISKLKDNPDIIETYFVDKAPGGAVPFKNEKGDILYYRTQEVDINISTIVRENRYFVADNAVLSLDKKLMDKYAINPLSYSDKFKAITGYLLNVGNIPLDRLSKMISELSNSELSIKPSTIVKWNKELSSKAFKFNEENLNNILNNHLMFVDETGVKINGDNYWFHVLTNDSGTYFIVSDKRGGEESETIKLLEGYTGYLHHDHFKSYYRITSCKHSECNA
ncbi:MAG: transposase, partial [Candidatus Coprovivens sp.]